MIKQASPTDYDLKIDYGHGLITYIKYNSISCGIYIIPYPTCFTVDERSPMSLQSKFKHFLTKILFID